MSNHKHLLSATAILTILAATPAFAENPGNMKKISFNITSAYNQKIHIISTDREKWNKIKPGQVRFYGKIDLVSKRVPLFRTLIRHAGVVLGRCGGYCNTAPLLYQSNFVGKRKFKTGRNFILNTARIPVSSPGHVATQPFGNDMIRRCNQHLSAEGPSEKYSFDYLLPAMLVVDTVQVTSLNNTDGSDAGTLPDTWNHDIDFNKTSFFRVKVVCDPVIKPTTDGFAAAEPNFKVKDVKMFLSTFSHATTKPNKATVCKKGRVLVRISTSKKGPVKFRLWTKVGNKPMQNQVIEAWSSFRGSGKYHAEYKKWVTTSKNATFKAMVEDMTNPIGQSSGWKNLKLNCTGAGGGGLADKPNTSDPDNNIPDRALKVTGKISLSAKSQRRGRKSRKVKVFFRIWANKKGDTRYHLNCGKNRIWQGSLKTSRIKGGKYRGFRSKSFTITKSERVACALRSKSKPGNPVIALASKQFVVVKRNLNLGGKGGLTAAPRSTQRSKFMRTKHNSKKSAIRNLRRTKPAKVKKSKMLPSLLRNSRAGLRKRQ